MRKTASYISSCCCPEPVWANPDHKSDRIDSKCVFTFPLGAHGRLVHDSAPPTPAPLACHAGGSDKYDMYRANMTVADATAWCRNTSKCYVSPISALRVCCRCCCCCCRWWWCWCCRCSSCCRCSCRSCLRSCCSASSSSSSESRPASSEGARPASRRGARQSVGQPPGFRTPSQALHHHLVPTGFFAARGSDHRAPSSSRLMSGQLVAAAAAERSVVRSAHHRARTTERAPPSVA